MADQRIGLYPGTFDPVTNGHMDIIFRAARVVDKLLVGVARNAGKGPLFGVDERIQMVKDEVEVIEDRVIASRIVPQAFDGLLVDYAKSHNVSVIIRGLRAVSDFEYEFQMASMNRRLEPDIETLFLMSSDRHQFISSRFVKEIGALGGEVLHFVSPRVADRLKTRYQRGGMVQSGAASKVY